ncbi:MAG: TetR family transcriptional regulator [Bacteroidetes bacterium]|nr:TetR family transcriptional regulator [Bacteroidota bacterium]
MPKEQPNKPDKREKIIKVSLQLFAKHGYDATTIRMIAQESGISLGLLYTYFDGKNAVLKEIFDTTLVDIKKSLTITEEFSKPERRFEHFVEQMFQVVHKNLMFYRLLYSVRMQPSVQKLFLKELNALHAFIMASLEALLKELGVPNHKQEAILLYACLDGGSNQYVLHSRSYPIEEVKKSIFQRFTS